MKRKISENNVLEDGSRASTGHKPKKSASEGILNVSEKLAKRIDTDRKVESAGYKIRQEIEYLAKLTEEISKEYSKYSESDYRIDDSVSVHNGLGNMMKLIEVQTAAKLRIKKMQTDIMTAIANDVNDEELPYAVRDIMREVNISFLDSKLVRAYGELAKVMKEDFELAKLSENEVRFVKGALSSELEDMPDIEARPESNRQRADEEEEYYGQDEE